MEPWRTGVLDAAVGVGGVVLGGEAAKELVRQCNELLVTNGT